MTDTDEVYKRLGSTRKADNIPGETPREQINESSGEEDTSELTVTPRSSHWKVLSIALLSLGAIAIVVGSVYGIAQSQNHDEGVSQAAGISSEQQVSTKQATKTLAASDPTYSSTSDAALDVHRKVTVAPENAYCHDCVDGDACYKDVAWAKYHNILQDPHAYPGLSPQSSDQEFQLFLREHTSHGNAIPEPCVAHDIYISDDSCHDCVDGDECYKDVAWAKYSNILFNPQAYPGLSQQSSDHEFQTFLRYHTTLGRAIPEPCIGSVESTDRDTTCYDCKEGDECYEHVAWAKHYNIIKHPHEYEGLCHHSSVQEFQQYLRDHTTHGTAMPKPCTNHKSELAADQSLSGCLRKIVCDVALDSDHNYNDQKACKNLRHDIQAQPLAVVKVRTAQDVEKTVQCAMTYGVQVCARNGGHGFENFAGCDGGVLVDMQGLDDVHMVDQEKRLVRFGGGIALGKLYYILNKNYNLAFPGGVVNGVGAAGLILGCGRGALTNLFGLACDSVKGITYVDGKGKLAHANATVNADMYWIARGGGGEIPGIVTEFLVEAHPCPQIVRKIECSGSPDTWANNKKAVREWGKRLEAIVDYRKTFSTMKLIKSEWTVKFQNMCFDCDESERAWFRGQVHAVRDAGYMHCDEYDMNFIDVILDESGVGSTADLLDRTKGYNSRISKSGGQAVPTWQLSEDTIGTLFDYIFFKGPPSISWDVGQIWVMIYAIGGPLVEKVPYNDTAYGLRNFKVTLHTKISSAIWSGVLENDKRYMEHHVEMSKALQNGLPCKAFYNYMDKDMPCAKGDPEKWLRAFFSDVPRMQAIKAAHDPNNVFQSRLNQAGRLTQFTVR